jgi:hypothetical protein
MTKENRFVQQIEILNSKLGDKKGAIETAKLSLAAAEIAKPRLCKMNKDSIAE